MMVLYKYSIIACSDYYIGCTLCIPNQMTISMTVESNVTMPERPGEILMEIRRSSYTEKDKTKQGQYLYRSLRDHKVSSEVHFVATNVAIGCM